MDNYKKQKKEYVTNQLPYYSPYYGTDSIKNNYYVGYTNNTKYNNHTYNTPKPPKKYILPKNEWMSIFIPMIDSSYTREYLKHIIENKYSIGSVERIDLVKLRETEYTHRDDYSVFIHFYHWYYNSFTVYLRKHLEMHKSYHMKYYYSNFENNLLNIPIDYFILMKNRSDVVKHNGPKRKTSFQSIQSENSAPVNDTLLKQQKRIELLEDELDALRKLIHPKI